MTLRIESAAGFQGGAFQAGYSNLQGDHYSKTEAAAAKAPASDEKLAPPSPQKVASVSQKPIDQFPKLVGPEAPASLLFEVSLAASSKVKANQAADEQGQPTSPIFPRMINRRWVPSPATLRMLEEFK